MTRRQRPQDGELVRHFLVVMAMLSLVAAGFLSSDWVARKLDPSIEARERFQAMPVHVALRQHMPFEWERIEKAAEADLQARIPLVVVTAESRKLYPVLARRLLPFGERDAALAYAEAVLPVLQELRAVDPALCVGFAWPKAAAKPFDLNAHLAADTAAAYEAAVARLVTMNELATPKPPPSFAPPGSNQLQDMQQAYRAIREAMEPRYGEAVQQLHTNAVGTLDPKLACGATIELLSRALQEKPAVARSLTTELLRT